MTISQPLEVDRVKAAINNFMQKEKQLHQNNLNKLIELNHKLGGHNHGFYHAGLLFTNVSGVYTKGVSVPPIHHSLEDEATDHYNWGKKLNHDIRFMIMSSVVVISKCYSNQDIRDTLPEPIVQSMSIKYMERLNEEGHTLKEYPNLLKQFEKFQNTVYFYQANKLIF
jgi:hypothetical protein